MKLFKTIALLACFIGLVSLGAFADNASGTLNVSTTVPSSCNIGNAGVGTLAFPNYDPVNANATAADTATGTFTIQCTNGDTASVLLGDGNNGTTDTTRAMANGASLLGYQLYTQSNDTGVWPSTGLGIAQPQSTGAVQTVSVYGEIPAAQNVIAGGYSDTVTISLSF